VIASWQRPIENNDTQWNIMNKTAKALILSAAVSGLAIGTLATSGCKSTCHAGASSMAAPMNKHDCKGMNACKGQGGCKTSADGCKGMNSCKGKGGCKVT